MIDIAPLIGRAAECETLARAVADARDGHGATVVIAGEAGIGKSRLVAETSAYASAQGFAVLSGSCFSSDHAVPFAPVLDLLRNTILGRSPDEVAALLGPGGAGLVTLLPELAHLLPIAPERAAEPEHEKRRLIHAFVEFIHVQATRRPVLVVVEDLHWCDDTSLDLILTLARRSAERPVLLLLSHRSDEVHDDLNRLLQDLTRARLARALSLAPLSAADTGALLQSLYHRRQPPRADALSALHALTDGNPFFIEEVAKSVPGADALFDRAAVPPGTHLPAPRSVQEAVRRRVERLSPTARDTLLWAAVSGRRFDFDLLHDLTGRDERALLTDIRELIAAFLVAEEAEDRFIFRHALTRQAVLAGLLARERRALHTAVAVSLERRPDAEQRAADLAFHYHEAGNAERTLHYARHAGESALAMYSPRAAVEQFSRALTAVATLRQPAGALHHARARAFDTLGEFEPARADYEAAVASARTTADRPLEWRSLLDLGFLWAGRDYRRAGEHFQQALTLARAMADPRAIAYSLNRFGNWRVNIQQPEEAIRLHQEALALLENLDDAAGVAETLDLLGMAHFQHGELIQAAALFHQAARHFARLDHRYGLSSSLAMRSICGTCSVNEADIPAAISHAERIRVAERAAEVARDGEWHSGVAFAAFNLALVQLSSGGFGKALHHAEQALAIAREIEHRQWTSAAHSTLGGIYLELFDATQALQQLEIARRLALETGSRIWISNIAAQLAQAHLLNGDCAAAAEALAGAFDATASSRTLCGRLATLARAELTLAQQRPEEALHRLDDLLATARNAAPHRPIPRILLARGEALLHLDRTSEACATLEQARAAASATGYRPVLLRILTTLTRAHVAAGGARDAAAAGDAARHLIDELAAEIPAERTTGPNCMPLRSHFTTAALATIPTPRRPTALQAAKAASGGLTTREREVAALVARGLTNRELAATLVLGERTVETHVTNILAKLGFTTRAQIAAWVTEHGVQGPPA